MGLERLDDASYPAFSMGRAAELLGVQPAFLRSLDAVGLLRPQRSSGGHRRYSRDQLTLAARVRDLLDESYPLVGALRVVALEDELHAAKGVIASLRGRLRGVRPRP